MFFFKPVFFEERLCICFIFVYIFYIDKSLSNIISNKFNFFYRKYVNILFFRFIIIESFTAAMKPVLAAKKSTDARIEPWKPSSMHSNCSTAANKTAE